MTKKEHTKDLYLKRKYGISLGTYNTMFKNQNGSCAICKKPQSNFKKALSVDHDHKTGEVRGLLCFYCNKFVIGRHTKESVLKLIQYLLPNVELVVKEK